MFHLNGKEYFEPPRLMPREQIVDLLTTISQDFRKEFEIQFKADFARKEWKMGAYIVWMESTFNPTKEYHQFFYDDGDEYSDEYPDICCTIDDIAYVRKLS